MGLFVLVGGWPGSGKSTLAEALAADLRLPLLAKDEIKEALTEALGVPSTVVESRWLGKAAVLAMLRVAARCDGAVLDSTWFEYTRPGVLRLPGRVVEVCCVLPLGVARARYRARTRNATHRDLERDDAELWGTPFTPLGIGPRVDVDTSGPVDVPALAAVITAAR
jgi:predicted kinase